MSAERRTFLRAREVLTRTEADCRAVRKVIADMEARTDDERVGLLLASVGARVDEVERALHEFRESAPDEVSETYTQYTAEAAGRAPAPPGALTVENVTTWVVELGDALAARYDAMADLAMPAALKEAFANFAEMVRGQTREVVRDSIDAQEL